MANDNSETVKKDATSRQMSVNLFGGRDPVASAINSGTIQGNAFDPEDEYQAWYVGGNRDAGILEPPYKLRQLDRLCQENNALQPCIEAMVTNVDGTGYTFETKVQEDDPETNDDEEDTKVQELRDFFGEPYPGMSFTKIRRLVRRDIEKIGNGYLEVIRNPQDEIVFFKPVDGKMMRLVKLDEAVAVTKQVMRKGKPTSVVLNMRERRFCQVVNGISLVYFREFGSSRDLNKKTGKWADKGSRLPANVRATEIIHFTALPDAHTPYGVPRWISQTPSVLGSRKAEELNLDFFNNGGVPPVMIILQGGQMMPQTRQKLEQITQQGAMKANRVAVIEVESTGGDLDGASGVAKVTVERFGAERQSDSMFENYDAKCEERIRRSFRLPPIFVGAADSYTFATAFASYTVAEAQVFKPERDSYDETVTMGLLADMGYADHKLVSKPLVIEDGTLKLQGIELGLSTNRVDYGDVVKEINEATGTALKLMAPDDPNNPDNPANKMPPPGMTVDPTTGAITHVNPDPASPTDNSARPASTSNGGAKPGAVARAAPKPIPGQQAAKPANGGAGRSTPRNQAQKADVSYGSVTALAKDAMTAMRLRDTERLGQAMAIVTRFDKAGHDAFKKACAELHFIDTTLDPRGLSALTGCTMAVLAAGGVLKYDPSEQRDPTTGEWVNGGGSGIPSKETLDSLKSAMNDMLAGSPKSEPKAKKKLSAKKQNLIDNFREHYPDSDMNDQGILALAEVLNAHRKLNDDDMQAGVLYHGTTSKAEASIREKGIVPQGGPGSDTLVSKHMDTAVTGINLDDSRGYVFATPYKVLAKAYAGLAVAQNGGKPIIFEVDVPAADQDDFQDDPKDSAAFRLKGAIKPEWIAKKLVKGEDGGRKVYVVLLLPPDTETGSE